jgi:hypothetical protein
MKNSGIKARIHHLYMDKEKNNNLDTSQNLGITHKFFTN